MDDGGLLRELEPVAERLLARHETMAREWFPHELVPWARAGVAADPPLPPGVQSALVVNLLTEDNLPYYTVGLARTLGQEGVWWEWARRWTAEEMRHATVLRDYLCVTRAVDLVALERARMAHVSRGTVPAAPGGPEAFVYLALQELATRIAHAATGARLDDDGRRIMQRVAADENLHHLFYRDLVGEALVLDPARVVCAIDHEVRHFAMPGASLPDFRARAAAIAAAGIFSATTLVDDVLGPTLRRHWQLPALSGLDSEAERARDRVLVFLERLGTIAPRLVDASGAPPAADAGPPASW
jgi:acyl-[acyl-carrier-protein] desaturase